MSTNEIIVKARDPTNAALYAPILINQITHEPYLPLPLPPKIATSGRRFIMTPPRTSDAHAQFIHLNDKRVYHWLSGPPYPYELHHGVEWIELSSGWAERSLRNLEKGEMDENCPVDTIREVIVDEEGGEKEVFVGKLDFLRCIWMEYADGATEENKEELEKANKERKLGDEQIVWTIGDWLVPAWHSQGIMSTAVHTVLHTWGIPKMGIRNMLVVAFQGNEGSMKVMQKAGFVLRETREKCKMVKGEMRGMYILEWRYKQGS